MIREYDEVKQFIDRKISSRFLSAAIVVDEIYIEEYNALDVRIIGMVKIPTDYYLDFKNEVKQEYGNIVSDFEIIAGVSANQTSIIIYLKSPQEIRSTKIRKIKNNILI